MDQIWAGINAARVLVAELSALKNPEEAVFQRALESK